MAVRIEIYKKGSVYTSALEIVVTDEDRGFLEGLILENGMSYKVTPIEQAEEDNENW